MIAKRTLNTMYVTRKLSMMQIARELDCSHHQVAYWMDRHAIERRSISDAVYQRRNPNGDPFMLPIIDDREKAELYGIGLGLYWGEGTKANRHSVRLGNSDPNLIKTFMKFLIELYAVDKSDLRFGLQTFTDINTDEALGHWAGFLEVRLEQFYKVHVTISNSLGTYRHKSRYGVVTLYYNNKRLRDILVQALPGYTI